MLKGLRKRETYEELLNELEEDPIKRYPDRRASQIENSNYMSQLALGFQEVVEQNNRLMKEKTKELLLQDAAASGGLIHHTATPGFNPRSAKSIYNSPLQSLTSHGLRNYPGPGSAAQHFSVGTPQSPQSETSTQHEFRQQLFGVDVDPDAFFQSEQR